MTRTRQVEAAAVDEVRTRVDRRIGAVLARAAALGFLGQVAVTEQIDHALGFVATVEEELCRPPGSVLDLGTGGGLPGLVLAACWQGAEVVLVDANERRTDFLREVVSGWGDTGRVHVVRGRAEELGREPDRRERVEVVTARSFGPPAVTAECGAPFVAVGGRLVVSEPPGAERSERWPAAGLATLGLSPGAAFRVADRFGFQVLLKDRPLADRFPRRVGVPAKRPLF